MNLEQFVTLAEHLHFFNMQPFVDLHIHSSFSDGTFTPAQIISIAQEKDIAAIAITDHDTMAGAITAATAARQAKIHFLPGIELSAHHGKFSVHILGYFPDCHANSLQDTLQEIQQNRRERNDRIFEKIANLDIELDLSKLPQDVMGQIGRPHIARLLVEHGIVKSEQDAFSRFLKKDGKAYVPRKALPVQDAINAIHSADGIAILAHPGAFGISESYMHTLLGEFQDMGINGIEVYHPINSKKTIQLLLKHCKSKQLVITGGSDFHGRGRDKAQIGEYSHGKRIIFDHFQNIIDRF